jgi:hypothetical protein
VAGRFSNHLDYALEQLQRIAIEPEQAASIAQSAIAKLRGRTCPGCGVYFIAAKWNQYYHSRACSVHVRYKRYLQQQIERLRSAHVAKWVFEHPANGGVESVIVEMYGRTCVGCGVYFETKTATKRYHTRACRVRAREKHYWQQATSSTP